jgi:hypothetical protein
MCPTTNSNIQLMKLYCTNDPNLCTSFYACDFVDSSSVGLQSSLFLIDFFFQLKKKLNGFCKVSIDKSKKNYIKSPNIFGFQCEAINVLG